MHYLTTDQLEKLCKNHPGKVLLFRTAFDPDRAFEVHEIYSDNDVLYINLWPKEKEHEAGGPHRLFTPA